MAKRRLGELLLCTGLRYGSFRFRDHRFGTLYRGAEFITLPCINGMAIVERSIVDFLRTRDQLTKRCNGFGKQSCVCCVSGRLRHLFIPVTSER